MKGSGSKKNIMRVPTVIANERQKMKTLPPCDGYSPAKKIMEKIVSPIKLAITPYIIISIQYSILRCEFSLYFSVLESILKIRTKSKGIKYKSKHKLKLLLRCRVSIKKCYGCIFMFPLWKISPVTMPYPEEYLRGEASPYVLGYGFGKNARLIQANCITKRYSRPANLILGIAKKKMPQDITTKAMHIACIGLENGEAAANTLETVQLPACTS